MHALEHVQCDLYLLDTCIFIPVGHEAVIKNVHTFVTVCSSGQDGSVCGRGW